MSPGEVAAILFGAFGLLVLLRVPVAFALGLACMPVFFIDPRLTPFVLLQEMFSPTTPSCCWRCRSSCWPPT